MIRGRGLCRRSETGLALARFAPYRSVLLGFLGGSLLDGLQLLAGQDGGRLLGELLGALRFFVNPKESGFVTGVVLPVDGGFSAYSGV